MAEQGDVPPETVGGVVGEDEELETPGYKPPKLVDLDTIQKLDADDESLVKYKEQLLGKTEGVLGNVDWSAFVAIHHRFS